MQNTKLNERSWSGQIISWINELIQSGETIFEYATNDESVKLETGVTKFPDILLYTDKITGTIFNGWELKFPDTDIDDNSMLLNALEKAKQIKSNSFVTWNGRSAIIWKISDDDYSIEGLSRLKVYPNEKGIHKRNDLEDRSNYQKHEQALKERLFQILIDLQHLFEDGVIKEAITITNEVISTISNFSKQFIPHLKNQISDLKNASPLFRNKFNEWKIIENATLRILAHSSRRAESVNPEEVLSMFVCYKLIGKIIFYLTIAENLNGKVEKLIINNQENTKDQLDYFFKQARKIDYQAVFDEDFTDCIKFNKAIDSAVFHLIEMLTRFDFRILPSEVIGNILQNLVPDDEKLKFGQYFTPENLAKLVAFPAIKSRNSLVFDPTSGTGTFLDVSYNILKYLGKSNHQELLNQLWGNDISHFPAVLSVINLYKQKVSDTNNFPRITRRDFFNLEPKHIIKIPDNKDINMLNNVEIPIFDSIVSNFPFIQQEDIPNKILLDKFQDEFGQNQLSFLKGSSFIINARSDYYVYCFYNSLKFLKNRGQLSAITSNAWLGKDYGSQFKRFLLDNFSIRYIVKSKAEHWFKNSQVSTIYIVLQKGNIDISTKFVTINSKLEELFDPQEGNAYFQQIEDFYAQIDNCDNPLNTDWQINPDFNNVYCKKDGTIKVSLVSRQSLFHSLENNENWDRFFIAEKPFSTFDSKMINPQGQYFTSGRGTRTGQDKMFILSEENVQTTGIERQFLFPCIKSSQQIKRILHNEHQDTFLFYCDKSMQELKTDYPNTFNWVSKWEGEHNRLGKPLPKVLENNKPYWYSLKLEDPAEIFISINPNERLFFGYSLIPVYLNQRLVSIRTNMDDAPIVCALLNSVLTLLNVEFNGVSRNLGALDLNANFFKNKVRMLNPGLLSDTQKSQILEKFIVLCTRPVLSYKQEFIRKDRKEFDQEILKSYGFNIDVLPNLYNLLLTLTSDRIEMKDR